MEDPLQRIQFRNEYHKLLVNMYCTNRILSATFDERLEKYGITMQQYKILKILQNVSPEPMMMTEIKEMMIDKNSDVTRILDRLTAKNLVLREHDAVNRRKMNMRLTENGNKLVKKVGNDIQEFEGMVMHLNEEEAISLNKLIDKVRLHLLKK